jgi:hypothetical protein
MPYIVTSKGYGLARDYTLVDMGYRLSDIHTRGQKGKSFCCDPCDLEVAPYDYLTTDIHTREIL